MAKTVAGIRKSVVLAAPSAGAPSASDVVPRRSVATAAKVALAPTTTPFMEKTLSTDAMINQANAVGCKAPSPKAAVNPAATKLKEDIASAGISLPVDANNKMLAGKISQRKTRASENAGAPFMATQTDAAAPAASEFKSWRRMKLSWRVLSRGATSVAGGTNLAVRPSSLGKKPKIQLRSVPLRASPRKVDKGFRDLLQLIGIERFLFDHRIPRDREALENPAKDSTAPESLPVAS